MYLDQTEVKFGLNSSYWIHAILSYFFTLQGHETWDPLKFCASLWRTQR